MLHFRITKLEDSDSLYRIDQKVSLFFGLVKYWREGIRFFDSRTTLYDFEWHAKKEIIEHFPTIKHLLITNSEDEILFFRNFGKDYKPKKS